MVFSDMYILDVTDVNHFRWHMAEVGVCAVASSVGCFFSFSCRISLLCGVAMLCVVDVTRTPLCGSA